MRSRSTCRSFAATGRIAAFGPRSANAGPRWIRRRRWRELDRRIDLYERRILAQASEQSEAALAAYRSDAGDFADVMRAYIDELDLELELARLYTERAQSYAVLANLGGLPR